MLTADQALARLRAGNTRFVEERPGTGGFQAVRPADLIGGQTPYAVILGCSDSRVPAEIVFDGGLGDLYVVRVAGNVVAPSQIGSIEYAVEVFGTRLVLVVGHSRCGAVTASVELLITAAETPSPNLGAVVDRIRPSIEPLLETPLREDRDALIAAAVRSNIRASARQLRNGSTVLAELIEKDGLRVVGAHYDLVTGRVEFFDDVD